jgi:DNA sulfur modification protein DndC
MEARRWLLAQVLQIQEEVNQLAQEAGQPKLSLINSEELARIHELWAAKTWPNGWEGTEPHGDALFDEVFLDGSIQRRLPLLFEEDELMPEEVSDG